MKAFLKIKELSQSYKTLVLTSCSNSVDYTRCRTFLKMTNVMEMKRSNLILPLSGYELDREEMCYVEGGAYAKTKWWGIEVYLTGSEFDMCKKIYDGLGLIASSIVGCICAPAGIAVAVAVYLKGSSISPRASVYGAKINITWAHMAYATVQPYVAATLLPIYAL